MGAVSRTVASSVMVLSLLMVGTNLIAYVRQLLLARYFGATDQTDAYFASFMVCALTMQIIGNVLSTVFVPIFHDLLARGGRDDADRYTATLVNLGGLGAGAISVGLWLAAPFVMKVVAPGFEGAKLLLAADMLRIVAPVVIGNTLCGVLAGVLNAQKRFGAQESLALISATSGVATLMLCHSSLGIHSAAWAALVTTALQTVLIALAVAHFGYRHRWSVDLRDPGLTKTLRLSLPVLLGSGVGFIAPLVDRVLASFLSAGSMSGLDYGEKIIMVFSAIVVMPLSAVLLTAFSELCQKSDLGPLYAFVNRSICTVSHATFPIAMILLVLAEPLVILLFGHGAFGPDAVHKTTLSVRCYTLWLVSGGIGGIASRVFYARQMVALPIKIGVFGTFVNAILKVLLVVPMGIGGLALATSASSAIKALITVYFLRRDSPAFSLRLFAESHVASAVFSAVAGAVAYALYVSLFQSAYGPMVVTAKALSMLACTLAGLTAYIACSALTRNPDGARLLDAALRSLRSAKGRLAPQQNSQSRQSPDDPLS